MRKSEIDDIFASKGKSQPIASSSTVLTPTVKKKKKKKQQCVDSSASATKPSKKRPPPETVIDPSASMPSAKRLKPDKGGSKYGKDNEKDDEERFKDSRGSGPRRKTEEGYSIYKEDELGMRDEGGDTPLCPFDCQCCF